MIISVLNLKGGSGKTTASTNLATFIAAEKKEKVLIIDTDQKQQSSVKFISQRPDDVPKINVFSLSDPEAIKKQINDYLSIYKYIIIDGAPAVDVLASTSIALADIVILPVNPSPYDIWATEIMLERIESAQQFSKQFKKEIKAYFLINRFSQRQRLSKETQEALGSFSIPVLKTKLGHRTAYPDSAIQGLGAIEYSDPKAKEEVINLGHEILDNS